MTFDEHLKRAFETLTDHLRDEIGRHTQQSVDALTESVAADRDKAVAQAKEDAERAAAERLISASATARADGHNEGLDLGRQQGKEDGIKEGIKQGIQEGIKTGLEQGRQEAQKAQETSRQQGYEQGLEKGREQGRNDGFEKGRKEGLEEGVGQGLGQGRQEGLAEGRKAGEEEGRRQGVDEGRREGLSEGRQQGMSEGRKMAEAEAREALESAIVTAVADSRSADLAASERLIEAVRAIDRARSLSEILDTLVGCAGKEAGRVGIWLVRAGQFRCWRMIGFDLSGGTGAELTGISQSGGINDADGVGGTVVPFPRMDTQQAAADVGFDDAGVMAEALRSGAAASGDGQGRPGAPVFAALPAGHESLAIPIAMGAQVVAVLYADQGFAPNRDRLVPATWPETLEVLTRHAARCLEALTAFKAARALTERPGVPEADVLHTPGSIGLSGGPSR